MTRKFLRPCGFLGFLLAVSLHAPSALCQLSTEDHLAEPGFWPTQDNPSRDDFTGPDACARCHRSKAASQKETPMARAAMSASLSDILHAHPLMSFGPGKYKYQIEGKTSQSRYSVRDGNQSLSFPLLWAFGTGRVGQSYLFKKQNADFFEARVTYFETLGTIDFTPSRASAVSLQYRRGDVPSRSPGGSDAVFRLPHNWVQHRRTFRRDPFGSWSYL